MSTILSWPSETRFFGDPRIAAFQSAPLATRIRPHLIDAEETFVSRSAARPKSDGAIRLHVRGHGFAVRPRLADIPNVTVPAFMPSGMSG